MQLDEKVALVTGATRGIGKAIALALAKQGATVAGTATTQAGADKITEEFKNAGVNGQGFVLDVTDNDNMEKTYKDIQEKIGTPQILVNNAAITRDNLFLRMKEDEWDSVVNTNLNAIFHMTKLCLRPMLKTKWGRIISVSSVVGVTGNPGQTNYAAAKAGVIGFTKSLAHEVASRNITVNVVAHGFIDTDMTRVLSDDQRENLLNSIPAHRLGQPDDIANTVMFLTSGLADYITGQTIHVNGGMYMS